MLVHKGVEYEATGVVPQPGAEDSSEWKVVLEVLRRSFDYVIVDTGAGVDEFALAAIERSTDLLALCSMDVASATSLKKELIILDRLEMTGSTRHFVLNRVDARVSLTVEEIEELIGLPVAVRIPNTSNVTRAMNVGRPFLASSPRAPESRAVRTFVRDLSRAGDGVVDASGSRGRRRSRRAARR
jgi:pilus assembly protein CpaE